MATEWIDADFATIHRLAMMLDAEARGEGSVTLRREIRLLEDAFGLNPASGVRLRWEIGPVGRGGDHRAPLSAYAAYERSTGDGP